MIYVWGSKAKWAIQKEDTEREYALNRGERGITERKTELVSKNYT